MRFTKHENPGTKFPKLQIAINGNIFLMHNSNCGVQVYSPVPNQIKDNGEYFGGLHSSELSDFNGSITLEN